MGNRARYLLVMACLSVGGALVALNSFDALGGTYASSSLHACGGPEHTSLQVTPTLEYRGFLPAIMRGFCVPPTIPEDAKLSGVVFFDYNGDGTQQPDEPGIVGATISVGGMSTSSQCNGVYYFRNLPDGSYDLVVTAVGFWYLSVSISDFKTVGTPIPVTVSGSTYQDVGLIQGFLTLPWASRTNAFIYSKFDHDDGPGILAWDGDTRECGGPSHPGTYNNHKGYDIYFPDLPYGSEVVASAPGVVTFASALPPGHHCAGSIGVTIDHGIIVNGSNARTGYTHLEAHVVNEGDYVRRGDVVGHSGGSGICVEVPHLHWWFGIVGNDPTNADPVDPYDPVWAPTGRSYWIMYNNPTLTMAHYGGAFALGLKAALWRLYSHGHQSRCSERRS